MKYIFELTEEQKNAIKSLFCVEAEEVEEADEVEEEWPQSGDKYFSIDSFGYIVERCWVYGGLDSEARKEIGNIFKSKKEAEFAVERLKVIYELKQFAEKDGTWNGANKHYYLRYNVIFDCVAVDVGWACKTAELHFSSKNDAKSAIAAVGVDRIKKYYFGVDVKMSNEGGKKETR